MPIEYEATFPNIDKDNVRSNLQSVDATLVKPEFFQRRFTFHLPQGHEIQNGWLRVRDEGDKITMSLKVVNGGSIENQQEIEIMVSDFEAATNLLRAAGCMEKAYQETYREKWVLDDVEITIDTWPFLEPYVEIEGKNEESVRIVSEKLGFEYASARFCTAGNLYAEKYGLPEDRINNHTPRITFDMENPFI